MIRLAITFLIFASAIPLACRAEGTWHLKERDGKLKVFTKPTGGGYNAVKVVTRTKSPMSRMVAMLKDVPHLTDWMQTLTSAQVASRQSRSQYRLRMTYHFPWPYKDRDTITDDRLIRDPDSGAVTLRFHQPQPLPGQSDNSSRHSDNHVLMKRVDGYLSLTPEAKGITKVVYETDCDPGGSLPTWAYNMSSPDILKGTVRNLVSQAARQ